MIFGAHVHVGIEDPDLAVQVMNRSRPYLSTLLALTCSSPYWIGEDTGYDSFRTLSVAEMADDRPAPDLFADRADYDRVIDGLAAAGVISDGSKVYWDVRIPQDKPTVEFRVGDVCPRLDDAVMLAGLVRAVALRCARAAADGEPAPRPRPELLRAASWRAARSGVRGDLVDVAAGKSRPAAGAYRGVPQRVGRRAGRPRRRHVRPRPECGRSSTAAPAPTANAPPWSGPARSGPPWTSWSAKPPTSDAGPADI